jgi:hypothetical protein
MTELASLIVGNTQFTSKHTGISSGAAHINNNFLLVFWVVSSVKISQGIFCPHILTNIICPIIQSEGYSSRLYSYNSLYSPFVFSFVLISSALYSHTPSVVPPFEWETRFRPHKNRRNCVFRDVTPLSLMKVRRHFGETYRLHLQFRRISQARNQHKAGCYIFRAS